MYQRALFKNISFNYFKIKIVSHANKEIAYTCEDITHCKVQIYLKNSKPYILMCVQQIQYPKCSNKNITQSQKYYYK
jgi:hypothetical protein